MIREFVLIYRGPWSKLDKPSTWDYDWYAWVKYIGDTDNGCISVLDFDGVTRNYGPGRILDFIPM